MDSQVPAAVRTAVIDGLIVLAEIVFWIGVVVTGGRPGGSPANRGGGTCQESGGVSRE